MLKGMKLPRQYSNISKIFLNERVEVMSDLAFTCRNLSVQDHLLGREMRPRSINGEFVIISNEMDGIFAEEGAFDLKEFDNVCIGRSTIASTGRIALVPERAQEENLISKFLGCSVPIILRPVGNHYTLIDEAYIHGIMEGEAMEGLDKGNFKLQDFIMI